MSPLKRDFTACRSEARGIRTRSQKCVATP
nr:MAG TPA: hypothetical protein [Caudoviricetes sp.]DAV55763.1 MAG TPA: hypothetical protein [Caudoviricetes sp.]